jgi:hypothetical protein
MDCGCPGARAPVVKTVRFADGVPMPASVSPASTNVPRNAVGGGNPAPYVTAQRAVAALAAVVVALVIYRIATRSKKLERFYTPYAREEPTRPYIPYTGTEPYGVYGAIPWAYAYDLETPAEAFPYLPPAYRTNDVL